MNEGRREEARVKWVMGRLEWVGRNWGHEFRQFVYDHYQSWGNLEAAETWAGIQWGFIITPDGPQDLDEVAALEDIRGERVELLGQMAQAHGM